MQFSGEPVPVDWDAVESWLGRPLPNDYKALASRFGPLDIGEYVWLHVPCVQRGRFNWARWVKETRSALEVPPHMVPWGETRGGGYLFWDGSAADPDEWPVEYYSHDTGWHEYGMSLTRFLESVFTMALPGLRVLPETSARTAFLPEAASWAPPPVDRSPARQRALVEGTGLEALRALVVPPARPHLGDRTWEWLFGALGTRLPADYVELMEVYGGGAFGGYLRLWAPLDAGELLERSDGALDGNRYLRSQHPSHFPLPQWPEPGGFLPFGDSIDGDQLGWLTSGEEWPLIFLPRHSDQGPAVDFPLAEMLLRWLRGRLVTPGLARFGRYDDPLEYAEFSPWR